MQGVLLGALSTMRRASELPHIAQVGQRGIRATTPRDLHEASASGVHRVPGGEVARHGIWCAVDLIPDAAAGVFASTLLPSTPR